MNSPSVLSKILLLYLKLAGYKRKLNLDWWLQSSYSVAPPASMKNRFEITNFEEASHPVWKITPRALTSQKAILYLHGGGYSIGFEKGHWKFISKLIDKTGFTVWAPDYPLIPNNSASDVFEFLMPLYEKMIQEYGAENIILLGDSSGGGMSLALTQLLIQEKIDRPAQLILLSPWLDVTLSNPLIDEYEDIDPLLDRNVLQTLGKKYSGNLEQTHFLVSPVYGNIKRLPPTTLFIGSEELFLPDCKKLKGKAESEPIVFNYREFKGMVHNWMFRWLPEASYTMDMIANQVMLEPDEFEDPVNAGGKFW